MKNLIIKIVYFGLILAIHCLAATLLMAGLGLTGKVSSHDLVVLFGLIIIYLLIAILVYTAIYKKFIQDLGIHGTAVRTVAALSPVWGTLALMYSLMLIDAYVIRLG